MRNDNTQQSLILTKTYPNLSSGKLVLKICVATRKNTVKRICPCHPQILLDAGVTIEGKPIASIKMANCPRGSVRRALNHSTQLAFAGLAWTNHSFLLRLACSKWKNIAERRTCARTSQKNPKWTGNLDEQQPRAIPAESTLCRTPRTAPSRRIPL